MGSTTEFGNPRKHLKTRLILQVSGFVTLMMLLVTGIFAYMMSDNLINQLRNQLNHTTTASQLLLEQRIDYLVENTERLTSNPFIINGLVDSEGRDTYLPKLAESFSQGRDVVAFILVDYDGRPLFQTVDDVPAYNESPQMRTALALGKRSLYIQRPQNQLVVVAPISYYDTTQGAVIVSFDLATIVHRHLPHENNTYHRLYLNGEAIISDNYQAQLDYISIQQTAAAQATLLNHLGIEMELGLPASTYLKPVWLDVLRLIVIGLIFIVAAILMATWIGNSIAQPILSLHRRVSEMDENKQLRCSPIGTDDELEELAIAFDQRNDALVATQSELEKDIEARIRAQNDLEKLQHYLQNIIDSMPSMLIGINNEGFIIHWNHQAEKSSGINAEEANGKKLEDVMPMLARQRESIESVIHRQQPMRLARQVHQLDGDNHYADITIYPLEANATTGAVIRIDDITERVRMEEMMMQTEKMMSIGGLAAGMAHEINNPLGGILQGLQNIRRRLSPQLKANNSTAESLGLNLDLVQRYMEQRQVLHFMDEIADAGKRASDIVTNMLQFSRKPELSLASEDINTLVDKTLNLAAVDYDLKKKYDFRQIDIIRDYATTLPAVPCIASEIQQVLLNILRNAAQALQGLDPESRKPCISVRTNMRDQKVVIEIEDNGPGMEPGVMSRVFEPFYTTKPVGEGTGLGLSVSYFIIHDEHGGNMEVSSTPGLGTTFTITLPVTRNDEPLYHVDR